MSMRAASGGGAAPRYKPCCGPMVTVLPVYSVPFTVYLNLQSILKITLRCAPIGWSCTRKQLLTCAVTGCQSFRSAFSCRARDAASKRNAMPRKSAMHAIRNKPPTHGDIVGLFLTEFITN